MEMKVLLQMLDHSSKLGRLIFIEEQLIWIERGANLRKVSTPESPPLRIIAAQQSSAWRGTQCLTTGWIDLKQLLQTESTDKFAHEGSCCGQRQFGCAGSGNAEKGCAGIVFQEQGLREIRRNIQFSAENFFRLMNNLRHLIQMRGKCFPHRPFL